LLWKETLPLNEEILSDSNRKNAILNIEKRKDLETILAYAGGEMKEDELQAFILHYWEGLGVKEVTKMMGCKNITGARTLIQNARRKFARMIEKKGLKND
jgi:DNA-directed RNA polymerase specialized sigma24 family protein